MASRRGCFILQMISLVIFLFGITGQTQAQGVKQSRPESRISDADADHVKERNEWFYRGRIVRGQPSAELRRRAYQAKLQMRAQRKRALALNANVQSSLSSGSWMPLGPLPLASDA